MAPTLERKEVCLSCLTIPPFGGGADDDDDDDASHFLFGGDRGAASNRSLRGGGREGCGATRRLLLEVTTIFATHLLPKGCVM